MKGVQCYELFGGIALKNHTFSLISANAFYFHALSLFIDTLFVYFIFFICIILSAFNLFVYPNSMFTSFF